MADMTEPPLPDLAIRPAAEAEFSRALYLFRGARVRPQARLLVAVRSRPVERLVAAAACWPAGRIGCFQLACQPGISRAEVCARLVAQVATEVRNAGGESIQYGEALKEGDEWIAFLQDQGFSLLRSERFFEVAVQESWTRTVEAYEKHQSRIPPNWRTEPRRGSGKCAMPPSSALRISNAAAMRRMRSRWPPICSTPVS